MSLGSFYANIYFSKKGIPKLQSIYVHYGLYKLNIHKVAHLQKVLWFTTFVTSE